MKIIAAAAIVAFCVVLQVADSNAYLARRKALARQQIDLLTLTIRVLEIEEHIASLTIIDTIQSEFEKNVTALFNNATREIQDKVNAANTSGKPAQLCSTTALVNLDALNKTVVAEFVRTLKNTTESIFEFLHETDIVIEFARSIGIRLFVIPTNCHNADRNEAKACGNRLLAELEEPIKNYNIAANNILRLAEAPQGLAGWIESLENLKLAAGETSKAVDLGIKAIETSVTACIDALQIVQISPPRVGLPGIHL